MNWMDGLAERISNDPDAIRSPAYIYSPLEARRRAALLSEKFGTNLIASFKAFSLLDMLVQMNAPSIVGVETASKGEMRMLAGSGYGQTVYVNTPALPEDLIRTALGFKATFIVDTPEQIERIAACAKREIAPIFLRANHAALREVVPDFPKLRDDQFGMDLDGLERAADIVRRDERLRVAGLHCFCGSHSYSRISAHLAKASGLLLAKLEKMLDYELSTLILGCGLGEDWETASIDFAAYREALSRLPKHITVLHEAGRAIFATAGAFATRVIGVKRIRDIEYAICDGGLAQAFLLARTENPLRKPAEARLLPVDSTAREDAEIVVAGSSCSRDDQIGIVKKRPVPGDFLLFPNTGAYHRTYTMPNFLTLGEASVYVF